MQADDLVGAKHRELVAWLSDTWWPAGPPVCILDGFSGVGKTEVSRRLRTLLTDKAVAIVRVELPEAGNSQLDDLLLDLGQQLAEADIPDLAAKIDEGADERLLLLTLEGVLRKPVLIVCDEFQHGLDAEGDPLAPFRRLLERVNQHPERPGRILLLSSRRPREGRWSRGLQIKEVEPLTPAEGKEYLARVLKNRGRAGAIPVERQEEMAIWAGRNPEAINLLVAALVSRSLDELVGEKPKPWELRERAVSAQLLDDLKRELVGKVLADLDDASRRSLQRLSVHRRAVRREGIDVLSPSPEAAEGIRRKLVDLFLLDHWQGWYTVHSVAVEVLRQSLRTQPDELKTAHAVAAQHYARHFKAQQIVGAGRLGTYFVEARHHLVAADQEQYLKDIAARFGAHLKSQYVSVTPVPTDSDELDERIATLMALLDKEDGPKGLHYHLARCFEARKHGGDLPRALEHARRATGPQAPADAWTLRIRLEREVQGTAEAVKATREGVKVVSPDGNVQTLYQSCAQILERDGLASEAVELLREGIGRVPPENNVQSLYLLCGEILARDGQTAASIKLLREGIGRVPPDKNLAELYQSCAEILTRDGKAAEAVMLLLEGITKIGTSKFSGHILSQSLINIAAAEARPDWLDDLLALKGHGVLSGLHRQFAEMKQRQMSRDWTGAARIAHAARQAYPRHLALATQEAFALMCAGRAQDAHDALQRLPYPIEGPQNPNTWLACLVAVSRGDQAEATRLWQTYLGTPATDVTLTDLLQAWNTPRPLSTPHPSYYFPVLPRELTKLAVDLRRPASGAQLPPESFVPVASTIGGSSTSAGPAAEAKEASEAGDSGSKASTPVVMPATVQAAERLAVLAVATEWFSKHGGLSTLNRELCIALASAGHRVACLVPSLEPSEKDHARKHGVDLIAAKPIGGGAEPEVALVLRPDLPDGFVPNIILGHGRITGGAARVQASEYFPGARRVHFLHMAPGEIEFIKGRDGAALRAEAREEVEKDLCKGTALVVAIGPRLYQWAQTLVSALDEPPRLHQMNPGIALGTWVPKQPTGNIECLVLGRAEDLTLKGLDIAARAMGRLPDSRVFGGEPQLVVRGAPAGTGLSLQRELVDKSGRKGLIVQVREYSPDLQKLESDLRRSSLVLMPSRSEGFGLVALEGIVAGRPVLVTRRSGLGELLLSKLGEPAAGGFVVDVTQDDEEDTNKWSKMIEFALLDRIAAFNRAMSLREKLSHELSWANAVRGLIQALDVKS